MNSLFCIFCDPGPDEVVLENDYAYARYDTYPTSPVHLFFISKRPISSIIKSSDSYGFLCLVKDIITQYGRKKVCKNS